MRDHFHDFKGLLNFCDKVASFLIVGKYFRSYNVPYWSQVFTGAYMSDYEKVVKPVGVTQCAVMRQLSFHSAALLPCHPGRGGKL